MNSGEKAKRVPGTPKKERSAGFRLKYIGERLKELSAERDRLTEERKSLKAFRKSKNDKTEETEA